MVRYAHAKEDKEARRDEILAAALTLFLQDTRRLPTVASIATAAGLAKGTVYIYFETKEQIFAALLAREWSSLLLEIEESFDDKFGDRDALIGGFTNRFASFLDSHPYFLRLDSLGYVLLEANLSPDDFWRFKDAFSAALQRAGHAVDACLALQAGRGQHLLLRSYALARGLWQALDFPDRLRGDERFAKHPLASVDFRCEFIDALYEYWRGACPSVFSSQPTSPRSLHRGFALPSSDESFDLIVEALDTLLSHLSTAKTPS